MLGQLAAVALTSAAAASAQSEAESSGFASPPGCWGDGYDEKLCCTCGFPACWTELDDPEHAVQNCCPPGSIARVNRTVLEDRMLLCKPEVRRCRNLGPERRDCRAVATYMRSLNYECRSSINRFVECGHGVTFTGWTKWRHRGRGNWRRFLDAAQKPVPAAQAGQATEKCLEELQELRHLYLKWKTHEEDEASGVDKTWFEQDYITHLRRCNHVRAQELKHLLGEARRAFYPEASQSSGGSLGGTPAEKPIKKSPRVGVVIAIAPKEESFYSRTLDMWHCYCEWHGDCEIILETEDFLKLHQYPIVRAYEPAQSQVITKVGKAWNRWYALRKHISAGDHEWLFTADPDQFISQQCYRSEPLSRALQGLDARNHVVMRDFARFQTLNSAGVFFRSSAPAGLFVDLMLSKLHWSGLADFDQSAFDHTVLEFQEMYFTSHPSVPSKDVVMSSPLCLARQLMWVTGQFSLSPYFECWHDLLAGWLGPLGERRQKTNPLVLVDPRTSDFNYVLGARSAADAPLVWHLAGRDKYERNHKTGESVLDELIKALWKIKSNSTLPKGAGFDHAKRSCRFWLGSASRRTCHPGTEILDCRVGSLAVC
eukprot:TRINITY_DN32803_c0_g6_i1.p1 TRINITY_DN32803_c0_g6~~TRINITY_DN32803_c0_g6_i1.p1  ORF type:complete len:598 (+),score=89.08 TRINITY_DN32803_c0_g6_i1:84-1877(+)